MSYKNIRKWSEDHEEITTFFKDICTSKERKKMQNGVLISDTWMHVDDQEDVSLLGRCSHFRNMDACE